MEFAILFLAVILAVIAIAFTLGAAELLLDPFRDYTSVVVGIVFGVLLVPLFGAGSITAFTAYRNYCPPLVPVAAPELAEDARTFEQIVTESQDSDYPITPPSVVLISRVTYLNAENERLANELSLKTTALTAASESILELQNRIKVLESTRINAPAPTTVPVAVPPTAAPARKQCRRGGCN